jgi:hypothetical protein
LVDSKNPFTETDLIRIRDQCFGHAVRKYRMSVAEMPQQRGARSERPGIFKTVSGNRSHSQMEATGLGGFGFETKVELREVVKARVK